MNGYFKPLRRKIGVVTLAMACVLAAGWVRSYGVADKIKQSGHGYHDEIGSAFGIIYISEGGDNDAVDGPVRYEPEVLNSTSTPIFWGAVLLFVPYWSICIPLTLLSAWLLLSKIRNPKPQTEPDPSKA